MEGGQTEERRTQCCMNAILAGIASCLHAVPMRVLNTGRFMEQLSMGEAFIDTERQPAGADTFSVPR